MVVRTAYESIGHAQFCDPAPAQRAAALRQGQYTSGLFEDGEPFDGSHGATKPIEALEKIVQDGGASEQSALNHVNAKKMKTVAEQKMLILVLANAQAEYALQVQQINPVRCGSPESLHFRRDDRRINGSAPYRAGHWCGTIGILKTLKSEATSEARSSVTIKPCLPVGATAPCPLPGKG